MTTVWVIAAVSTLISLALDLIPGLSEKWAVLGDEPKRWVWLTGCLAVPLVVVGLSCINLIYFDATCDVNGVATALAVGAAAYIPSQISHAAVKTVKKRFV